MEVAEMGCKWLQIAKAEFFVLTARFKGHRKLLMGLVLSLGLLWAVYFAPLVVELVLEFLTPITQIRVILQVMFPGLMRVVMLLLWMLLLIIPLGHALSEIKIGQWEILLASNVKTRDILVGTFLGKIPSYTLYVLVLAPLLLSPFLLALQVSLLGQLLIYATLTLMVLMIIWLSNIICAALQAKLGDSSRGNDIAKALALLMGLIVIIPVLGLQLFATQFSAILGLNVFLMFPFTWSADLVSWLAIIFNGINLTASQIAHFQHVLQFDLLTNGLLVLVFGVVCIGIGLLSAERLFTYRIGARSETVRTVKRENILLRGLRKINPSSFGSLVVTSFKTFFRQVQNLSKIAMALTLSLILPFLLILVYGQRSPITLDSLLPITGLGLAMMGIMAFSGTSFLESKDQLWMIQAVPRGTSRFVKARLVIAVLIALPLSLIPTTILTIMMGLELFQFFWLFGYGYAMVCGAALFGTGITALNPNYEDMKSPVYTTTMMIANMICLFVTMASPLILSVITRFFIGVSLDTLLVTWGFLSAAVGRTIITAVFLLILGTQFVLVGTRRLGRPDT
jgi:hypothetical protein